MNSNVDVRRFDPSHVAGYDGDARGWLAFSSPEERHAYFDMVKDHPSYTGFMDGKPLWCGGIVLHWRGVGEAWILPFPEAKKYARRFHESALVSLHNVIRENHLHRVQASVLSDFKEGRRWMIALGFQPESVMRKAGPNKEDMITFVLFPEGA